MKTNTRLLHDRFDGDKKNTGATLTPIYQTSAFGNATAEGLEAIFRNKAAGYAYTRIGNPTVSAFEQRMAALEHGIGAVAFSSGMAAITSLCLAILSTGDEIVASAGVFGGTIGLFADLQAFGITTHYVDACTPEQLERVITEKTRMVFTEIIGNPRLDVLDLPEVSRYLKEKGNILFVVDNTLATPVLVQALEQGADIAVHSSSKYINGSSNAISGVLVDSGNFRWDTEAFPAMQDWKKFGPYALTAKLRQKVLMDMGACLAPMNAFLNSLGMETLGLRMERQCSNALSLAKALEQMDGIAAVNYPGLDSSPWHETASRVLNGGYGAILTARLGTRERAFQVINKLRYAVNITNVGDVRTLVVHPRSTIYAHIPADACEHAGVTEDLIRVSVGIEDMEDLIEDFEQAVRAK
ncbi:MAG: PLP-dependent transferase [Eubacteriales bacterium]|nr:PLP-dependent transferase [Eubacteriales bacterium]